MSGFTKLNSRFGTIEFPVTMEEMDKILLEFPKTERQFYLIALKALKKELKKEEKMYSFMPAAPKLTKNGFLVMGEEKLFLVLMKNSIFPGADIESIKYKDIKEVDFDIIPAPAFVDSGVVNLTVKKGFGTKQRTFRSIPEENLDSFVTRLRNMLSN